MNMSLGQSLYLLIHPFVQYLLAPLTDTDLDAPDKEKPQAQKEHWRAGQAAIVFFLKNWTGLISLAADPLGLRSLVETLRVSPHPEVKVGNPKYTDSRTVTPTHSTLILLGLDIRCTLRSVPYTYTAG